MDKKIIRHEGWYIDYNTDKEFYSDSCFTIKGIDGDIFFDINKLEELIKDLQKLNRKLNSKVRIKKEIKEAK